MVRFITVEREYGSQGAAFAYQLAERLRWRLVDHCLIEEIANEVKIPQSLAERCDERLDPWYYRFGKAFWHGSIERLPALPDTQVFDSERIADLIKKKLRTTVEEGKCVIVGRGSTCALATVPGAFHVFVYASLNRKKRWFEQSFPQRAKIAEQELAATDKRRAAYVRRFYQQDWTDRRLYHLMLNSCMGLEAMVEATIDAAGLRHEVSEETPIAAV
jgi:cytidylate kinase